MKYGARHLKRAIERLLVQPLCNLIATHQVEGGDCVEVDLERTLDCFTFTKQVEGLSCTAIAETVRRALPAVARTASKAILFDAAKAQIRLSKPR